MYILDHNNTSKLIQSLLLKFYIYIIFPFVFKFCNPIHIPPDLRHSIVTGIWSQYILPNGLFVLYLNVVWLFDHNFCWFIFFQIFDTLVYKQLNTCGLMIYFVYAQYNACIKDTCVMIQRNFYNNNNHILEVTYTSIINPNKPQLW